MTLEIMESKSLFTYLFVFAVTATWTIQPSNGQQKQKFRITPHDLQVLEGSEALLRCEISNLVGNVQWTKDGFALGFEEKIPGFPRYSVLGDRQQGVFNLRVSNASLEDDAEYQCQVGPAKFHNAIRANARLTVISPPSSIEIHGYSNNAKVEVRENQDLTLTCTITDAKPAATIQWYRGHVEYKSADTEDETKETNGKRFTTISRLKLKPTSDDDYTEYSCQAKHKALQPDRPMRSTVQLSVLYPPGAPYIEGYTQGDTIRRGQTVELICRSRGGNPPAQLIWYKNGAQIRMAYRTAGRLSENIFTFTADANDNKARFRCEASNIMSHTPLKTEIDLTVLFAPTHVSITGPSEARIGDPVPLQCTTASSNPPAEIKWMIGGKQMRNATSRTVVSPEGGWITTSDITTVVEPNKRSLSIICHGLNSQLGENIAATHTVNVLYPPSTPIISGYHESSIIPAGSVQKLLCISSGGNPLATLTWYKNDKKINSMTKITDKSVAAELTILANVTDNQARYRCEAHNSATEIPLFETTTLSVHFAPATVEIRVEPEEILPGIEATLICDSSSSNPPAKLSWWRDGIPVDGINNASKPGLWGGTVSSLELKINATQELNGVVYTCQSHNEALQRSVHEAKTLEVLFPPKFSPPPSSTVVGVEGEPLQVAMVAHANPMSIAYTWTKDSMPIVSNGIERIVSEGPILNITNLVRSDAGVYTCEAVNSQGSSTINITVVVEYGATIVSISENLLVNPGEEATITCVVEGKPLNEEHVQWERSGYDFSSKTTTTFVNGTSQLHIKDAQRSDVGNFRCIADNRVANPTSRDILFIVKFAPEIDKQMLRAASGAGDRGRVPCRAQASPTPKFIWARNGQQLSVNKTYKYNVEYRQIDPLTYESILLIENVMPPDYGLYECVAVNDLGQDKQMVRLDVTSKPDPPKNLSVLNTTHDTVTIAWTPGFDGGMKASYRIRYREMNSQHYKYEDGLPGVNKLTVTGLKMNTAYLFSVMASNALGNSFYLPDLAKAQTKDPPSQPASSLGGPPSTTSTSPIDTKSGILLLVGIASGITIVLLNILLIGCCVHRRTQKGIKRGLDEKAPAEIMEKSELPVFVIISIVVAAIGILLANAGLVVWYKCKHTKDTSNQPNNKSTPIEMYAPSSYNDTVTGETLSSVSEKSDNSYSNDGSQPDYMDETRKKAASTYLVENTDMPPPRYQKDGTIPPSIYINNTTNSVHTRTLPHPRHNHIIDSRTRDDQMIGKGYIPSPSPAPPLDGSYYNTSDRYLSYPPMDYSIGYSTPPLPLTHNSVIPNGGGSIVGSTGSGTLRRGMRGIVPPDVTHHTNHSKSTHDLHQSMMQNGLMPQNSPSGISVGQQMNNLSATSTVSGGAPTKQPPGILKDPNRIKHNNMQILNVQNVQGAPHLLQTVGNVGGGQGLLMGYDPNTHNLRAFNETMGYSDADGHLV